MENWVECKLGQLITITSGNAFKKSEYSNKGIRLFQIANVSFNKSSWEKVAFLPESYLHDERYNNLILKCGDIVMALNRPMLDKKLKICQLTSNDVPSILYQRVGKFNLNEELYPQYFLYYLQSPLFIKWLSDELQGVNIPFINQSKLLSYQHFPLASGVIQKAIVKKIEELFSSLDSGIADLKKAQEQLVIYRQAVLKKAFEGEFKKTTVGDVFDFMGGGTPSKDKKHFWNGNIPWASVKDIKGDYLLKTQDFITEEGLKNSSAKLAQKDEVILITRISPGKSLITTIDTAINQDLKIVKPKVEMSNKYVNYLFRSIERICIKLSSGTTVKGINLTNLKEIEIPIHSIDQQYQIVREIESRLSVCDKVEESLKESLEKAKALRQSILKKAFEGKLLSAEELAKCKADQDYEPASVLLEKIKKEIKKNCFG